MKCCGKELPKPKSGVLKIRCPICMGIKTIIEEKPEIQEVVEETIDDTVLFEMDEELDERLNG